MDKGILGVSTDQNSEKEAKSKAMRECMAQGGSKCEVTTYVRNGCMAMTVGKEHTITDQAATLDEVKEKTMSSCNAEDTDCQVFRTACSLPKRIQ